MEKVGKRVMWAPEIEPAPEGPPSVPLKEVPNEESSTALAQEDSAMVADDAAA